MQELDKLWYEGLSAKGKKMTRKRLRSTPSDRAIPRNVPDYLINDAENVYNADNVYDADDVVIGADHSTPNSSFIET